MTADPSTALSATDGAAAAELRHRFAFLRDVVADMERRVPYAAAMVRTREGIRLDLRDGEQSASRLDPQDGVVLTASNGYHLAEASTDDLAPEAVRAMASQLVERALGSQPAPDEQPLVIALDGPGEADFATAARIDPGTLTLGEKLDRFGGLRRRLRDADARSVQAVCQYGDSVVRQVFVNRTGLVTEQTRRVLVAMVLFVSDGSRQEYAYFQRAATGGLEHLEVTDEQLAGVAEVAASLLQAESVSPGSYDVVTDTVTTGTIAHEAFGHGMETDMFLKERARGSDYIGRRVGSDLVNIVDDPTAAGGYGSYFVDDEGQRATPTQIIRDGILQRGLTDLYSAARLGLERTANGRRESVQRKAYARMSNTFFTPGTSTRDELLASLDDGIYLCAAENGMEDPKGWGIQIWAHYGREYRGGKATGRIFSPVAITGYVPDLLADVSMVSTDFALDAGTCGKGWKELVPVGSGGPHLRTRCRLG